MSNNIQEIYLKVDDCYLDCVSRFRIAIDCMNACFVDLIHYNSKQNYIIGLKEDCKKIANINNKFIRDLISYNELIHEQAFNKIDEYTSDQNMNLLLNLSEKIEKSFKSFCESSDSPTNDSYKFKNECKDHFRELKDHLNNAKEKITSDQIFDDFIESKINPLFSNTEINDKYNEYDDDADEDDNNNRRSYGNPWPNIPTNIQNSVNQFLSFVNSLISINALRKFKETKQNYAKNAIMQQQKIKEEREANEKRKREEEEKEKERQKERERNERRQKYLDMNPELLEEKIEKMKKEELDLKETITQLEERVRDLNKNISQLEQQIENEDKLKVEESENKNEIEKQKSEICSLTDENTKLKNKVKELEDAKQNYENNLQNILRYFSVMKGYFDNLKQKLNHTHPK